MNLLLSESLHQEVIKQHQKTAHVLPLPRSKHSDGLLNRSKQCMPETRLLYWTGADVGLAIRIRSRSRSYKADGARHSIKSWYLPHSSCNEFYIFFTKYPNYGYPKISNPNTAVHP